MAKTTVRDWDSTASNNTEIDGIGIQGTNAVSNFDGAFRELMSQIADVDGGVQPVNDTWTFCDPADTTKRFRMDAGSIATATTRVITVPDASLTLVGTSTTQTLTNKTFTDSSTSFADNTDPTKIAQFQCSGIATATTRTYTLPNADGTFALIGIAQTWTDTQTFSGVSEAISIRSTGVGTGTGIIRFRDSAASAVGYIGLGNPGDDALTLVRNTVGNITINAASTGTITLTGIATFNQAVTVSGAATLSSTLGVTGAATFSSSVAASIYNAGSYATAGTSTGAQVDANGYRSSTTSTAATVHCRFANPNSTVGSITTSGTTTAYNTSSDETWKDFIGDYDPLKAIEIIRRDPVRDFRWKNSGEYAVGWGAQTSHATSPDLATPGGWKDPITLEPWVQGAVRWVDPRNNSPWVEGGFLWVNPDTGEQCEESAVFYYHPFTNEACASGIAGWKTETGEFHDEEVEGSTPIAAIVRLPARIDAQRVEAFYQPWGVDQSKRTPYLWAALSWAIDKIEHLETRLAALETSS